MADVHAPGAAVRVWPSCAVPATVGGAVLAGGLGAGGAGATAAVEAESAFAEPSTLVPVTATRSVAPTSAPDALYDAPVAPAIVRQPASCASMRELESAWS